MLHMNNKERKKMYLYKKSWFKSELGTRDSSVVRVPDF